MWNDSGNSVDDFKAMLGLSKIAADPYNIDTVDLARASSADWGPAALSKIMGNWQQMQSALAQKQMDERSGEAGNAEHYAQALLQAKLQALAQSQQAQQFPVKLQNDLDVARVRTDSDAKTARMGQQAQERTAQAQIEAQGRNEAAQWNMKGTEMAMPLWQRAAKDAAGGDSIKEAMYLNQFMRSARNGEPVVLPEKPTPPPGLLQRMLSTPATPEDQGKFPGYSQSMASYDVGDLIKRLLNSSADQLDETAYLRQQRYKDTPWAS